MRLTYIHHLGESDTALNHVRQFVSAGTELGHRITVLSLASASLSLDLSTTKQSPGNTQSYLSYLLHEPKELLLNFSNFGRVKAEILRDQPQVVIVRNDLFAFSPVMGSLRLGFPVLLEVNSPTSESRLFLDQYLHLPWVPEYMEKWKLRSANHVTTVSTALRDHLMDQHRSGERERFTVVPNGADVDVFHPDNLPDPKWSTAIGQGTVVGFIGSFEKWHGPQLLKEMVVRVAAARPETRFALVGDGPGRKEVEQALRPLRDRVLFTGRVQHDRIPGITALLDVAVMPESNFYGSPLKVIEWMAAGRAIVAPDYGPLFEVIDSGKQGLLFKKRDIEDLVASVVRLVDDPHLRKELGEAAHLRAVRSLSWTHNAKKVIGACQRAIDEH